MNRYCSVHYSSRTTPQAPLQRTRMYSKLFTVSSLAILAAALPNNPTVTVTVTAPAPTQTVVSQCNTGK